MDKKRIIPASLVVLLAAGTPVGIAHAKDRDRNQDMRDTAALAAMKITLSQAIATAEQQSGGRAVGAEASQERGVAQIAVEVGGPQGFKTVRVDARTGQVTTISNGDQDEDDD